MDLLTSTMLGLWYLGVAVRVIVLILLIKRRWIDSYPVFTLLIFSSIVRSSALLLFRHDPAGYQSLYVNTQPYLFVLESLVAAEAFWRLAIQLRRFTIYGFVIMSACGAAGILAASIQGLPGEDPLAKMSRMVESGLAVSMLPALCIFLQFTASGISRNSFMHAVILASMFSAEAVAWMSFEPAQHVASTFLITGGALAGFTAWCFVMTTGGETGNPPPERPYRNVMPKRRRTVGN